MFSKATKWAMGCVWLSVVGLGFGYAAGGCFEVKTGDGLSSVDSEADKGLVPGQYIVVLKDDRQSSASQGALAHHIAFVNERGATLLGSYEPLLQAYAVANVSKELLQQLENDPAVKYIEQDRFIRPTSLDACSPPWGLDRIDQRQWPSPNDLRVYAHSDDKAGEGVDVYVFDTGIDATNPEFGGRVFGGFNAVDWQNAPNAWDDCHGHGTHVAAVIGGNTFGVAKNIELFAVRIFAACNNNKDCSNSLDLGHGTQAMVLNGIKEINKEIQNRKKPSVVLMNWEFNGTEQDEADVVAEMMGAVPTPVYVLSAGNFGTDACSSWYANSAQQQKKPLLAQISLVVGASTELDTRWGNSNNGRCVDLFAPGTHIRGPVCNPLSGTSLAAAHVAGVVARQWATSMQLGGPLKTAAEIKGEVGGSISIGAPDASHGGEIPIVFADSGREGYEIPPCPNQTDADINCNPSTDPDVLCCDGKTSCDQSILCSHGECETCGIRGAPCCKHSQINDDGCGRNLECVDKTCTCGSVNKPCCNGVECESGAICNGEKKCQQCGQLDKPCCTGPEGPCFNSEQHACDQSGNCKVCGGFDQPCCNGTDCRFGAICNAGNTCEPCGALNHPCCDGTWCTSGTCDQGSCKNCGGKYEDCCKNENEPPCSSGGPDPLKCEGNRCIPCGTEGRPCCSEFACYAQSQCNINATPATCTTPDISCSVRCMNDFYSSVPGTFVDKYSCLEAANKLCGDELTDTFVVRFGGAVVYCHAGLEGCWAKCNGVNWKHIGDSPQVKWGECTEKSLAHCASVPALPLIEERWCRVTP